MWNNNGFYIYSYLLMLAQFKQYPCFYSKSSAVLSWCPVQCTSSLKKEPRFVSTANEHYSSCVQTWSFQRFFSLCLYVWGVCMHARGCTCVCGGLRLHCASSFIYLYLMYWGGVSLWTQSLLFQFVWLASLLWGDPSLKLGLQAAAMPDNFLCPFWGWGSYSFVGGALYAETSPQLLQF